MLTDHPILHIITRLEAGGAPKSLLLLLEGLSEAGIPVELATGRTPPPEEDMLPEAAALGIPVHAIPSLRRDPHPWYDLTALISLWRLIRRTKPVIVHAHTSKAGFIGRFAARLAGVSHIVYSPRGTILEGYFTGWKRQFFTGLDRIAARWTSVIIGLTREESASYIESGIGRPEQHIQIPIGIDHALYAPPEPAERTARRREHGIEDDEVLMVTSGRLVPVKDQGTLISALDQLGAGVENWKCWIFGAGPEEARLRGMIDVMGLADRIRLWGFREDLADLLGLADLFVLSSINEGFGRVLLEAMSARLAIVATAVGGVPSVLDSGRAGRLVPASDPEALAVEIRTLLGSRDERASLSQAAYERVCTVYTSEVTTHQHISLYESLIASEGPH
ncbi:glycosyltransferase [Candidatus Zixiibacteriota bacterium]